MSWLSRLFGGERKKEFNAAQWTTLYPSDVSEGNLLANNKEWVFVATDKVAKAVSSVRFKVMRYAKNGDDREVFDGPLVDFLAEPSPQFSGKAFVYLTTAWKELTGNAFWRLKGKQAFPLPPLGVRPKLSGQQLVGYSYFEDGKEITLSPKEVLHDRYIDPRRPYWGVGKLEKIARWVDTSSYANEFLRLFFVNGAQFGGFITTEEETPERIELIKLGLVSDHVGVQNAHKIAVLPKGSDFKEATASMADIQFRELDEQYRDKILAGFGVPKTLAGFTTEVNRASAEASEYIFAKYTVKPIVEDFVEFLNTRVAPLFDSTGKYYFAYDEFVPENEEQKLKEREIALNKQPYKTVNEVRADVGLPPVKGGDVIYGNPLQVPLGSPPTDPVLPDEDDPDDGEKPKKALPRRARAGMALERVIESIAKRAGEVLADDRAADAENHKVFVARVTAYRDLIAEKVRDFNGVQERQVIERIQRLSKAVNKTDLFDMAAEVGVLIDLASPLLRGLMTEQAVEEYKAQGFDGAFKTDESALSRIVELAAKRLAKSYNSTTADLLKAALNEGIQANEGFGELAKRIQQVYEYSNQVRALMVAQTESFYIANEGSREAYRQSGVVETMRWYTADDEKVCEFCGPQDGRIIGINEDFFAKGTTVTGRDGGSLDLNYRTIDVPPLHPLCRCFIRPERIEVKGVKLAAS